MSPQNGDVYCTLTDNDQRGSRDRPGTDAANPRAANVFGHVVRWSKDGGDAASTSFTWSIFAECGDPSLAEAMKQGIVKGDACGSPDGLWIDPCGLLWIWADISMSTLGKGDQANMSNDMMLAGQPRSATIAIRRRDGAGPRDLARSSLRERRLHVQPHGCFDDVAPDAPLRAAGVAFPLPDAMTRQSL